MSILELIFNPIFATINFIFSIIPVIQLPESFELAFELLETFMVDIAFFIPLNTIMQIIILLIAWYSFALLWLFFNYLTRKIPFLDLK